MWMGECHGRRIKMRIETERLLITEFVLEMAEDVHKNSLIIIMIKGIVKNHFT